jgi:hypothetical protein
MLGPVRERFPGEEVLLEPGTAGLAKGQLVLLHWTRDTATELRAGRVAAIQTISALDGANYLRAEIEPVPVLDPLVELAAVEVLSPTVSAHPNLFAIDEQQRHTGPRTR